MSKLTTSGGSKVKTLLFANFLVILLSSFGLTHVQAQQPTIEIRQETTNPDGGFGFLAKRLGEKVELFLSSPFPSKKEQIYEHLSQVRLAELKYVVEKNDMANFEKSTIRYSTASGEWAEYINKHNLNSKKEVARQTLTNHLPIIEDMMGKFDPTTAEWRFIKQDLDAVNIYISQLK